jgi:hypothetical protein
VKLTLCKRTAPDRGAEVSDYGLLPPLNLKSSVSASAFSRDLYTIDFGLRYLEQQNDFRHFVAAQGFRPHGISVRAPKTVRYRT